MTTVQEAHMAFVAPLSKRFGPPPSNNPDEFFADLTVELAKFGRYQLESAAREITRTRTQRGFPTFAECIAAVDRQPSERPKPQGTYHGGEDQLADWKRKRDAEKRAAELCRGEVGEMARREGWLTSLLDYATEQGRLPKEIEFNRLREKSKDADRRAAEAAKAIPAFIQWRQAMKDRAIKRVFGEAA